MGIYFKGMKMPENCLSCDVNTNYNYCPILRRDTSNIRYDKRFDDCPIVEVREPHGRLIDADKAYDTMVYEMCGTGFQSRASRVLESEFYTPTIIEAEGAEE